MPLIKKIAKQVPAQPASKVRRNVGAGKIVLPDVTLSDIDSEPMRSFETQALMLHSYPGIGKTTLASHFPDAHFFMFETGAEYLRVKQRNVESWPEWCAYKDAFLGQTKHKFAVIDVLEDAFDMCFDFMCREVLQIEHPNDEKDYGKSWGAIYSEFVGTMYQIIKSPRHGVIFNSHSGEKQFKPAFGEPYEMIRPSLSSRPLERLLGKVHICGYLYRDDSTNQNAMQIRPDSNIMAKCRPDEQFLYTDGSQIVTIPMGNSSEESFSQYRKAYENKLVKPAPVVVAKASIKPLRLPSKQAK